MASYLRPRRGSYNAAATKLTASNPLKSGEVFFECDNIGAAQGKIKLGNSTSTYSSLPYFLSMQDSSVGFTDVSGSNSKVDSYYLDTMMKPDVAHSDLITYIKQLLYNHSTKITALVNSIGNKSNVLSTYMYRISAVSVPANSSKVLETDVTRSGYKCLGMIGFSIYSENDTSYVYMAKFDEIYFGCIGVQNKGSAQDSVSGTVTMLYVKN